MKGEQYCSDPTVCPHRVKFLPGGELVQGPDSGQKRRHVNKAAALDCHFRYDLVHEALRTVYNVRTTVFRMTADVVLCTKPRRT